MSSSIDSLTSSQIPIPSKIKHALDHLQEQITQINSDSAVESLTQQLQDLTSKQTELQAAVQKMAQTFGNKTDNSNAVIDSIQHTLVEMGEFLKSVDVSVDEMIVKQAEYAQRIQKIEMSEVSETLLDMARDLVGQHVEENSKEMASA